MPELASDPDLGGTGKERGVSCHLGHHIGGAAVRRSDCFIYWGSPRISPHYQLINRVMVDAEENGKYSPPRMELLLGRTFILSLVGLGVRRLPRYGG